jgi:hypothetical protein
LKRYELHRKGLSVTMSWTVISAVIEVGSVTATVPGRLRGVREPEPDAEPVVLAATGAAQLYGAALGWPDSAGRPSGLPVPTLSYVRRCPGGSNWSGAVDHW